MKISNEDKLIIEDVREKLKLFDDKKFKFDPKPHKYTYDKQELISVTTFLKNFCEAFDTEYWSKKKAAEMGTTQENVLAMWKNKTDIACIKGNAVHDFIENFFKGKNPKLPSEPIANESCVQFIKYYKAKMMELIPITLEQRVFDLDWGISGTIDSLFFSRKGLWLGDWKTNGKFRHDSDYSFNKMLLKPFGRLKDNEFNKYSIQVSLYRLLLQKQGIDTEGAFICHIPSGMPIKVYKALDLRDDLTRYFEKGVYKSLLPDNDELLEMFPI